MTTRKNKTPVIWPDGHFTIKTANSTCPDMKEITLRFRIKRAITDGVITAIGKIQPPIGRPELVFAKANPSPELMEAAIKAGMLPLTKATTTVVVMDIKSPKTEAQAPVTAEVSHTVTA